MNDVFRLHVSVEAFLLEHARHSSSARQLVTLTKGRSHRIRHGTSRHGAAPRVAVWQPGMPYGAVKHAVPRHAGSGLKEP